MVSQPSELQEEKPFLHLKQMWLWPGSVLPKETFCAAPTRRLSLQWALDGAGEEAGPPASKQHLDEAAAQSQMA